GGLPISRPGADAFQHEARRADVLQLFPGRTDDVESNLRAAILECQGEADLARLRAVVVVGDFGILAGGGAQQILLLRRETALHQTLDHLSFSLSGDNAEDQVLEQLLFDLTVLLLVVKRRENDRALAEIKLHQERRLAHTELAAIGSFEQDFHAVAGKRGGLPFVEIELERHGWTDQIAQTGIDDVGLKNLSAA